MKGYGPMKPLKTFAKSIITGTFASLPAAGRDAIAKRLIDDDPFNVLTNLADRFNVVSLNVAGRYGVIEGSPADASILGTYATTGGWAGSTNALLIEFFANNDGGTYVDIGANIGLTTIPVATNPRVTCFAVEPDPKNYGYLKRNVAVNCKNANVTTLPVAVFSHKDTLELETSTFNFGDHRIRLSKEPGSMHEHTRKTVTVDADALDSIIPPLSGPVAVKIDTQGAEVFVFKGGLRTLKSCALLIVEFWPYGMARLGTDAESVVRFLEEHFKTVALATEERSVSGETSVAQAATHLRRMFAEQTNSPDAYVDIIARR
jgi:FkbM family methyltransferase